MILNEKIINNRVLDLFKIYNFYFGHLSVRGDFKI